MYFNLKVLQSYSCLLAALFFTSGIYASDFSFSKFGLTTWKEKSFSGYTEYRLVENEGVKAVHAMADSSASGLFTQQSVNLNTTPILSWRWRIAGIGQGNNEQSKAGDDYPARLYVIVKGEPYFWSNRVLEYVWSNQAPLNSSWHNPFASQFRHIAVETGARHVGQWRTYQRDVRTDFHDVFGFIPKTIDALAIMSDSDNSGQTFEAWYGDIKFSKEQKDD